MKTDFSRTYFSNRQGALAFQSSFAEKVAAAAKNAAGHFVTPRNTHHLRHGGDWHNPASPHSGPGQFLTHTAESHVTVQDLIDQRLDVVERSISQVAERMHEQFMRSFIQLMNDSTSQSGNVVDGRERPLSETFLEMLEQSNWSVNERGEIERPMVLAGPQLHARLKETLEQAPPEFRRKADAIIEQKIETARREEVERKGRFRRYGDSECV